MWEVLDRTPRGNIFPRKLSLLLATILLASFGYILGFTPTAHAAADAEWDNQTIRYNNQTYDLVSDTSNLPSQVASSPAVYMYVDSSKDPQTAHFIYFNTSEAQSEKEATYIRYTLNPPNSYSNEAGKKTISIAPVPQDEQLNTEDSGSSCTIDGIGWMVCPLMNGIAEGMDFIFEKIRGFLVVTPMTTDINNPVYRIWQVSRDLANVAFVIGFLIIIYNYIIGGGMSGYEIRKIIPRLVIAAILINISYVICAVAVDISNIAGYGVNQLFETVRESTLTGSVGGGEINWTSVTTWVLAGGTGAIAGGIVLNGAVGGAAAGLWFLLAPFLLGAALVVMVTFLILAARQAIIILAIAIAPLAFAAYILPNTEKWFEKWRSLFFTMLVMFPAFAAVFGGAQLAGNLIIRMAAANGSIELIILGLGVMVAPLAITPLLLKLGGGVLNRIGGIINNKEKGMVDRYKNYNKERLEDFRAKQNFNNARRDQNGNLLLGSHQGLRRAAYRQNLKKHNRKKLRDAHTAGAEAFYNDNDDGIETAGSLGRRVYANAFRNGNYTPSYKYGGAEIAGIEHRSELLKGSTHARHEEHWQHELDHNQELRAMQTQTRHAEGRAKIIQSAHEDQDTETFNVALNNAVTPNYAHLRTMKVNAAVSKGIAENAMKAIEADGSVALAETILTTPNLRQQVITTHEQQSRAAQANELIEDDAKAHWEELSLSDRTIYSRQLERQANAKQLKASQDEWQSILLEAGAGRTDDYQSKFGPITQNVATSVQRIQSADEAIAVEAFRKARGEYVGKVNLNEALKQNPQLLQRAAGIDEEGSTKVLADLTKEASGLYMQNVEAAKSVFTNDKAYTNQRLKKVYRDGVLADGVTRATLTQRHAALQRLIMETGNNYAVQDIIDFSNELGVIEDRNNPGTFTDIYGNALTDAEVDSRRDTQQIINDAYAKSKNKVDWHSGTDRGNAETGRHVVRDRNGRVRTDFAGSELSIASEINKGKVDRDRALGADIDVIDKQAMVLADARVRSELLDVEAASQYADTLEEFLKDPLTGMRLEKRKRGSYHVLLKELRAIQNGDPIDLSQIENDYVDVESGEVRTILSDNKVSAKARFASSQRPSGPIQLKP